MIGHEQYTSGLASEVVRRVMGINGPARLRRPGGRKKTQVLILLVVGCTTFCAARRVRDYTFDVTGTVAADDGTALQDVEVVLQVDTPVYEGMTPVTTQRIVTSKGAFIFRCLSRSSSTKYTVTVRKEGFEPQTVSGTAPPAGNFTIRLKGASRKGTVKPEGDDH
jgi:hypothetical protein